MKQYLLKSVFLLFALVVGMSSAWADDIVVTLDNIGTGLSSTANTTAATTSITATGTTNSYTLNYFQCKKQGNAMLMTKSVNPYISNKTAMPGNIKSVEVFINTGAAKATTYNCAFTTTECNTATSGIGAVNITGGNSHTFSNLSNGEIQVEGAFFCVTLGNSNNGQVLKLVITCENSSNEQSTTTTIDASGITNTNKFVGTSAGSLAASVTYGTPATAVPNATVTWSGNNDAVATINSTSGEVTLVGAGVVTFTASYAGVDDEYASSSDTYVMNVTNEDPSIVTIWSEDFSSYSANNVPTGGTYSYSCANGGSTTSIYANAMAGGTSPELLVSNANGSFAATIPLLSSSYAYSGDLTLTFKTNAKEINVNTTTDGITIDEEENEGEGVTFTTAGTHTVTFKGVTTSTDNITIVFTATSSDNVRLDDILLRGVQAALTKVATPTISPASGPVVLGTEVTMTCVTDGASIYYTTDGTTPTSGSTAYDSSNKPTITASTTFKAIAMKDGLTDSEVATVSYTIAEPCATPTFSVADGEVTKGTTVTISSATEGATIYYTTDGSTPTTSSSVYSNAITINSAMTLKAIAVKDGYANSEVGSAAYTIPDYASLPFSFNSGKSSLPTGLTSTTLGSDYSSAPKLKFDDTGDILILKFNEAPGELQFDIKGNGFSGGTFTVQYSADGNSYTDLASYTSLSDTQTESFMNIPTTSRYIKWIYTEKSSGNVALGNIKLQGRKSATLNASGYATYASTSALDFSDDSEYTAWQITSVSGNTITFSQITGSVAAGTGVLLQGAASSTISIPAAASGSDISSTNKLVGITTDTEVNDDEYYGLKGNEFVKVNAGTVPAGKALLPVNAITGAGAKAFTFVFSDANAIDTVRELDVNDGAIYNLAGQKMQKLQKGINIVNGKKVFVK